MASTEHLTLVKFTMIPHAVTAGWCGGYNVTVTYAEARRIAAELLEATAAPILDRTPAFHGIELTPEQWDKLEENVRKAKSKPKKEVTKAATAYSWLPIDFPVPEYPSFRAYPDVESAKRKKQTKKPKKSKPKQEPTVAPKRKK